MKSRCRSRLPSAGHARGSGARLPAALLLLAPALIVLGVFHFFPLLYAFYISLHKWRFVDQGFVGPQLRDRPDIGCALAFPCQHGFLRGHGRADDDDSGSILWRCSSSAFAFSPCSAPSTSCLTSRRRLPPPAFGPGFSIRNMESRTSYSKQQESARSVGCRSRSGFLPLPGRASGYRCPLGLMARAWRWSRLQS